MWTKENNQANVRAAVISRLNYSLTAICHFNKLC